MAKVGTKMPCNNYDGILALESKIPITTSTRMNFQKHGSSGINYVLGFEVYN